MPATPALQSKPVGGIKVATPSDAPQAPLRTDKGVTEVLGDESVSPMALEDLTTKVYAVPLVRPATSQEAVAKAQPGKLAVQVCPPGDAVTVYCKGLGVVEAACAQDTVTLPSPGAPMGVPVAAGTGLTTVTLTVAVALPLMAPVAVMVWVVADWVAVGVPLITPVELFNDRPAGNAGLTEKLTAPEKFAAVNVDVLVMAVPTRPLSVCVAGVTAAGAVTVMSTVAVAEFGITVPEVAPVAVTV